MFVYVITLLVVLTIFSLIINIDGSTIGFLGDTMKTGITECHAVTAITTVNIFLNTTVDGNVVSITHRNVVAPVCCSFCSIVYVFLTIVIASIILLSIFGALNVPASAAIDVIFRLLNNTFTVTLVNVIRNHYNTSNAPLALNSLLGARGTVSIVLNVFLSITVTFTLKAVIR